MTNVSLFLALLVAVGASAPTAKADDNSGFSADRRGNHGPGRPGGPGFGGPNRPGNGPGHNPGFGGPNRPGNGPGHNPGFGGPNRPGHGPGHNPGFGGPNRPGNGPGHNPGFGGPNRPGHGPGWGGPNRPGRPGWRPGNRPGFRPGWGHNRGWNRPSRWRAPRRGNWMPPIFIPVPVPSNGFETLCQGNFSGVLGGSRDAYLSLSGNGDFVTGTLTLVQPDANFQVSGSCQDNGDSAEIQISLNGGNAYVGQVYVADDGQTYLEATQPGTNISFELQRQ